MGLRAQKASASGDFSLSFPAHGTLQVFAAVVGPSCDIPILSFSGSSPHAGSVLGGSHCLV